MPTLSQLCGSSVLVLLAVSSASQAQDLHIKKNISAGGYVVSTTETSIKGARERSVTQSANGSTVTLRQCDLRRTVTMDEANQTYFVADDPQDENAAKAAALATGSALPDAKGGKITVTTTITDTGERKVIYGYQARHLKAKVTQEPSADACTQVRQSFEIDGWFADLAKELGFLRDHRASSAAGERLSRQSDLSFRGQRKAGISDAGRHRHANAGWRHHDCQRARFGNHEAATPGRNVRRARRISPGRLVCRVE